MALPAGRRSSRRAIRCAQPAADPVAVDAAADGARHDEPDPGARVPASRRRREMVHHDGAAARAAPPCDDRGEVGRAPHPVGRGQHGGERTRGRRRPSGRQFAAALAAARSEDRAAGAGAHAQPEAVRLRPAAVVRLEGALAHGQAPKSADRHADGLRAARPAGPDGCRPARPDVPGGHMPPSKRARHDRTTVRIARGDRSNRAMAIRRSRIKETTASSCAFRADTPTPIVVPHGAVRFPHRATLTDPHRSDSSRPARPWHRCTGPVGPGRRRCCVHSCGQVCGLRAGGGCRETVGHWVVSASDRSGSTTDERAGVNPSRGRQDRTPRRLERARSDSTTTTRCVPSTRPG